MPTSSYTSPPGGVCSPGSWAVTGAHGRLHTMWRSWTPSTTQETHGRALQGASGQWREITGGRRGQGRLGPPLVLVLHRWAQGFTRTHPRAAHVPCDTGGQRRALTWASTQMTGCVVVRFVHVDPQHPPAKPAARKHACVSPRLAAVESCSAALGFIGRIKSPVRLSTHQLQECTSMPGVVQSGRRPLHPTGTLTTSPGTSPAVST